MEGVTLKKQRTSIDNQKCLRYWFYETTLINGCTTKPDPEGSEEKEWCRI
jgi:hypothetical protein